MRHLFVDRFGNPLILKRLMILVFGIYTYPRFNIRNKTLIRGSEILKALPKKNVLFVSNHQTYYADVAAFFHIFSSARWGFRNTIKYPIFLLNPVLRLYFVAAKETMESGLLPRIFKLAGSISVKRTWREKGQEIQREVDQKDPDNISKALSDGWVITFPQGTTKPFVAGRKGTAHLIRNTRPIVVPITIDGFRRAFDKKGILLKGRNVQLKVQVKEPLDIDYGAPVEDILDQIMHSIEQTPEFNLMGQIGNSDGSEPAKRDSWY